VSNGNCHAHKNGNGQAGGSKLKDVKPGEAGEMLISGPQVMLGYFSNPQQTAQTISTDENGVTWLHTGDIARIDAEGFCYILDRKKDMIIRGGLKIFPQKVEQVLRRHPRVMDVAVVGRADAVRTETVVAVVVVTERIPVGSEKGSTQHDREEFREMDKKNLTIELKALCREHLAPYEVPSHFEFVKELPRSPLGKLLKRELRKGPVERPVREVASALTPVLTSAPEAVPQRRASDPGRLGSIGKSEDAKPASGMKSDNTPEKEVA
jgi:acyl-CoA synthetase (AMP-forming)/AMP-acid ligase II